MGGQYIVQNGVHKLNPSYKPATATYHPYPNRSTALAVVSAPPEEEDGDVDIVVTSMYKIAVTEYQNTVEPEIFIESETERGEGLAELNKVLAKYEVPAGLLSKLLTLNQFDVAEIIVDDSGSMQLGTDAKGPNGESLTRWEEARLRILQMIEIMAYVICPPIYVRFLNRKQVLHFQREKGEPPAAFISRVENQLTIHFNQSPSGSTPALEAIQESMIRNEDKAVLRYFLGDGVPNGGVAACKTIENILCNRANPEKNPFTFMSCTGQDDQVEWMKECEEIAPYCSEFDDYLDESREILRDQGKAFPYSYGLHLVGQIVAAFNPHDLDAMDESVPFTRYTLDSILGYKSSSQEYKYYFDSFLEAQHRLNLQGHQRAFVNQLKSLYGEFETKQMASDIPAVANYKLQNRNRTQYGHQAPRSQPPQAPRSQPPPPGDGCCVIL